MKSILNQTLLTQIKGTKFVVIFMFLFFITSCDEDDEPTNILPVAEFGLSNEQPNAGESISFTDRSTDEDGRIVKWLWNFGGRRCFCGSKSIVHF